MSRICPLCGNAQLEAGHHPARVCKDCSRLLLGLSRLLESFGSPAALVARDHTVLVTNSLLRRTFNEQAAVGLRIGETIGCRNAAAYGPCGETFACPHCGLKRLIELSRLTGERLDGITTRFQQISGPSRAFKLSTEKAGEAILLKVAAAARQTSDQPTVNAASTSLL